MPSKAAIFKRRVQLLLYLKSWKGLNSTQLVYHSCNQNEHEYRCFRLPLKTSTSGPFLIPGVS